MYEPSGREIRILVPPINLTQLSRGAPVSAIAAAYILQRSCSAEIRSSSKLPYLDLNISTSSQNISDVLDECITNFG